MNYYKQGDAANADKIKAAFEKLGYNTRVNGWSFNADCGVYFTNEFDKSVDFTHNKTFVTLIKTHQDYQELELSVEPKFKVGDKIQAKDSKMYVYTVLSVDLQKQIYLVEHNYKHRILFTKQDNFELVPKSHYDIANFKPFDKVLVRDGDDTKWSCNWFSHYSGDWGVYRFVTTKCVYAQCIPFNEKTKHLLGTTDMCPEEYVNW